MLVLSNVLVPASQRMLSERVSAEISQNVTARFLNAGQFMHPVERGSRSYIREITPDGRASGPVPVG
jgi:lipopolysaccharide export system permease protein